MLLKKAGVALYDVLSLLIPAALLLALTPSQAFAYVDPSVMTYTIQALAGVAVALSTVVGVAFRRTRKKLLKVLNIDENAGKEVDPIWARVGEDGITRDEYAKLLEKTGKRKPIVKKGDDLDYRKKGDAPSWLRRFILSLVVVCFCGFTLGVVAPFEMVAGNASSLTFGLSDIWGVVAAATAVLVLILSLLLSLLRGKVFAVVFSLCFAFGLCCYFQAMFLNVNLPSANGDTVNYWQDHATMMVVSTIVWLALLVVVPLLAMRNRTRSQAVISILSICLIFVQAVGVASLFAPSRGDQASEGGVVQVTEDGLFEVSPDNNVIVFVLDRFDANLMNSMLADDPRLLDEMTGFTYYKDNVGTMIPTLFAVPNLVTGEEPKLGESIESYRETRYSRSSFLKDISAEGYSVGLYSDSLELGYMSDDVMRESVADYTVNLHSVKGTKIDKAEALKMLAKCALYRDMPWVLKWRFWFYTDEVNGRVVKASMDDTPEDSVYLLDDARYYERLSRFGLNLEEGTRGAFRFIHLIGSHTPYTINENAEYVGVDQVTREQQTRGVLHIVNTYMDMLKEKGLYKDATIIVTSDHGDWVASTELPEFAISPIMLVKPSGMDGEPLSFSDAPVSHEDLQATIMKAVGGDWEKYGTPLELVSNSDRQRDAYMITADKGYTVDILKYQIDGNVLDFNNWSFTGETWNVADGASS